MNKKKKYILTEQALASEVNLASILLIYRLQISTAYYTCWGQYWVKISSDYLHLFPRK